MPALTRRAIATRVMRLRSSVEGLDWAKPPNLLPIIRSGAQKRHSRKGEPSRTQLVRFRDARSRTSRPTRRASPLWQERPIGQILMNKTNRLRTALRIPLSRRLCSDRERHFSLAPLRLSASG